MSQPNGILPKKELRTLYLPPFTVAASHFVGDNPEENAFQALDRFIRDTQLYKAKPELRIFGFNNPSPQPGKPYGYEMWVTIPRDWDVPQPLVKKEFAGGLYAAYCIQMGDFQEWQTLAAQIEASGEYCSDPRQPLGMGGCLEEHLNVYYHYASGEAAPFSQIDLLSPIREK